VRGGDGTDRAAIEGTSRTRLAVVHVVDNLRLGGTELNVLKISKALVARGVYVRVVLTGTWGPLHDQYLEAGIEVERVPLGKFTSPRIFGELSAVSAAVHRGSPDIVHSHDRYSNLAVAMLPRPSVKHTRYFASHRSGMPANWSWRLALRFAYRRADMLTANGSVAGEIAAKLARTTRPVSIVPNFLEEWCFNLEAHGSDKDRTRSKVEDAIQLGFVGRLEPVKRVDRLLRAASRLKEWEIPFRLTIVGDGSQRGALDDLSASLGVSTHVRFLGELPRRPLPQRKFDVLLLSSSSEGTPNAIVEAMACGIPVVATDVGGVSAVVEHGVTGMLVSTDDEHGFAEAVAKLALDSSLRAAFGRAALERAHREWREETVINRLINDVYRGTMHL